MERNFLMSVSHELRTPLTAIRGHVSALLEGVVEDPGAAACVARDGRGRGDAARAARRRHPRPGEARHASLHRHARGGRHGHARSTRRTRRTATRRGAARSTTAATAIDRPVITSDGDRVLQVVGNLISNAFQATPDGGTVSLELAQRNGSVHVAVEDSGPGIPAEKRERLFRPFISETGGGTGLGLAIAKELSAALGGRLELQLGGREGLALRARPAGASWLGGFAQRHDVRRLRLQRSLDPVEPCVHRAPALGEQVDQQRRDRRGGRSARTRASLRSRRAGGSRCSRGPSPRRRGATAAPPPRATRRGALRESRPWSRS